MDEVTAKPFVQFAHERLESGYSFADAMLASYRNILCSARFFMLIEKPGPLDDFALASRLSYFLWNSAPYATLLGHAAKGELRKPDVLRQEVERMLADEKLSRFVEQDIAVSQVQGTGEPIVLEMIGAWSDHPGRKLQLINIAEDSIEKQNPLTIMTPVRSLAE